MADYSIPWKPLDLMPGLSFIQAARNQAAQNARSDEYMRMEREAIKNRADRESAALKRQEEEDKRRHAIEAWSAMPALQRAAVKSVGMANMNPYGVKFEEDQGAAPSLRDSGINVMGGNDQYAQHAQETLSGAPHTPELMAPTPSTTLAPGQEGPEADPLAEAARFAQPDETEAVHGPAEEADESISPHVAAAQALLGQPRSKKLYATYQGSRFEVPPQTETTGFGEQYDTLYDHIMNMPGMTPGKALAIVAAKQKADSSETGRNTRATNQIDFRNKNREDTQTFQQGENEKYKLTFEQRRELTNIMARAKAAAAGAGPVSPGLSKLVGMKEAGATDEEIYAEAAKMHLSQKEVVAPVQNVVKNAAAGERAGQKRESLTATGEGTNPGDMWKSPQAATKGSQQIQRFHRVRERMQALIAHVEKYGERIDADTQQYKDRMRLAEAAAAAMRPYNELSSTDASMAAERAIMGPSGAFGHGWTLGANLPGLKSLLSEAEDQQKVNLTTLLRPGGGSQLAPALGGPRPGHQAAGSHPSQAPVGETRPGPDGRTYRKVGPNNWQPVAE